MSHTEYDPWENLNSSLHVGADILNFVFIGLFLSFSIYGKC